MKRVFADADYLIALLNPKEQLHQAARNVSRALGAAHFVTTEMVLSEVLAFYANKGPNLRNAAVNVAVKLRDNPNATVVPQTSMQFQEALAYYRQRQDKSWSLTDCASCQTMQSENIAEALTHDDHLQQAGFKALLRG
jgi:predicted nucleic acid-binding protein